VPLFRSTIGFDRLFDLAETAQRGAEEGYPPYNIERLAEDRYQITLVVAGFAPDEISITAEVVFRKWGISYARSNSPFTPAGFPEMNGRPRRPEGGAARGPLRW
jgi:hypothetical protein